MLYDELATVVAEAWALENDITQALADPASSAQLLSEIAVKVCGTKIQLFMICSILCHWSLSPPPSLFCRILRWA